MLHRRLTLIAALMSLSATSSSAEDAESRVETIGVDGLSALAIDERGGQIYVAASGQIENWALSPLRLIGVTEMRNPETPNVEMVVADLDVSPLGNIYSAGLGWNPEDLRILGGSVVGFEPMPDGSLARFPVYDPPERRTFLTTAQFGRVAFDQESNVYLTSPVDSTVLYFPDSSETIDDGTERRGFELTCGPTAQFSIVELDGRPFYFSSTTDGALIEVGSLNERRGLGGSEDRVAAPECNRVANAFVGGADPPAVNAVSHALLDVPERLGVLGQQLLLSLEPNAGSLHLWPIQLVEGMPLISRTDGVDLSIADTVRGTSSRPGTYTMLAASRDGSTIFVSGRSVDHVLHFSVEGKDLRFQGQHELFGPVTAIVVNSDGMIAIIAAAAEEFDGLNLVHVIERPDIMSDGEELLTVSRTAVMSLQERLNTAGYEAGSVDGLLGRRTLSAAQAFLEQSAASRDEAASSGNAIQQQDIQLRRFILGVIPDAEAF